MDYLAYVNLSNLPHVEEETRFIDGKNQKCLILPVESNQIKKGKRGTWLIILRLHEIPLNERMQTHVVQLLYLTEEYLKLYMASGIWDKTKRMGPVYVHDRTPSKKIDRTNKATQTDFRGRIILSDIPKQYIIRNRQSGNRYIYNVRMQDDGDNDIIYSGSICVDDIPKEYIKLDVDTGKKYIDTRFEKLERLDTYMNTHRLVIITESGSDIEIGRFKEWTKIGTDKKENKTPNRDIPDKHIYNTGVNQRDLPDTIDGLKF